MPTDKYDTSDATLIESWDEPYSASIHERPSGEIVFLSDGWDSTVYANRAAAIAAQAEWIAYENSDSEEEQGWAAMGQNIIDALSELEDKPEQPAYEGSA